MIGQILGSLGSLATAWVDGKTAVQKANAEIKLKQATGEIDWELEAIRSAQNSWKDKLWTIVFVLILAANFVPSLQDTMAQGFANLETPPLGTMGHVCVHCRLVWDKNYERIEEIMAKGDALKMLQKKCGVTPDGAFGPNTACAIANYYKLNAIRGAHLLGQAAHESGNFMMSEENLNYRASTMCRVWPSRFASEAEAAPYAMNPQKLANKVYNGRMGNAVGSNDGWLYAGKGFIQLTGKDNVRAFAEHIGRDGLIDDPSPIADELAMDSAIFFFEKNGLFEIADEGVNKDVIKKITRRVNGGYHGLDDRIEKTQKIYRWLS